MSYPDLTENGVSADHGFRAPQNELGLNKRF